MRSFKILLIAVIFLLFNTALLLAQDSVAIPDTLQGWKSTWVVNLNGSQASYSNWSQGGVNNIAVTGRSNATLAYKQGRFSYGVLLDTRFGQTRIQDEGVRKIDDRLFLMNRFLFDLGNEDSDFKIFGNIRFRTQFAEGFNYGAVPDGGNILISNFLAPAYFTQDAGLAYVPTDNFMFEAGLGLQQTFVRDVELAPRYGLDEGDRFRSEAGLTLGSNYDAEIATNILFSTSINTFTSFDKPLSSTDVYFSNRFTARINSYMNTSLSLDLVYNDDFSKEIQVAQVLSVGVSFNLR